MSGEGPDGRKRDVRLTPPPRIEPVGSRPRQRRADSAIIPPARRGRPWWAVPLALGLLVLAGVSAFVFLNAPFRIESEGAIDTGEAVAASRSEAQPETSPAPTPARLESEPATDGEAGPASSHSEMQAAAPSRRSDPSLAPAPSGAASSDQDFGRLMAEGLAALEAGDREAARAAFDRAAAIRPDSPEPAVGLARLEAATGRVAIEASRERARELIEAEQWHQAAADYRAVLEIDPTLTFARDGLRVAESRGSLSDRLTFHLERPERLSAAEVLDEVEQLLERAREVEAPGPRHRQQVAALERQVARVRVPVRVSLVSDALTDVTVYQVGRLGTFARRELELRPGTYTVVGTRAGYRDVRRQLTVEPGAPPEPFEIRCEEKI